MPKQNLTQLGLRSLLKKPGRHADGGGLYFRVIGQSKAYFVFRFRIAGIEREMSLGPYPELGLEEARVKHAELRKQVKVDKTDPLASRRAAKTGARPSSGMPTFAEVVDRYVASHESMWRSSKHARQWSQTLRTHAAALRDMPVDAIRTADVLQVLQPIWTTVPETASRVRARIETIIDFAKADDETRPNPARWKGHLANKLPNPRKVGPPRRHHAAMNYRDLPAFMTRLAEIDSTASRALRLTILTCARTDETLRMPWDEVSFDDATWRLPKERMKMERPHEVPLSDQALDILRVQQAEQGRNPFVFPGERPMRPLSAMAMLMLLKRLKVPVTVHGFRSAARSWMADTGVPFEVAEAALAHTVGNAVVAAYQRSSMLERRRPVLAAWATYVCGDADSNVAPLRPLARAEA